MQIYVGVKWCFDIDINGNDNLGQWILKHKRGGSLDSDLNFVMTHSDKRERGDRESALFNHFSVAT
jgi:hypothetical protein